MRRTRVPLRTLRTQTLLGGYHAGSGSPRKTSFFAEGMRGLGGDWLVLTKEGVHEGLGVEILQVFGGLPHADQPNGHV